ncbi:serine protease grass-like [Drosophila gunungcola]|uniref:serine protease grass-like n=1 Tax=Drosophila gunungcola TaxID=103775 RepID=UPI0022E994E2|nr:serine protease grass-like [Drosophila gunungcola]
MKIAVNSILVVLLACLLLTLQGQVATNFLDRSCIPIKVDLRLGGGHDASTNSAPWMAAIIAEDGFKCGGSLITNRFVLTAAHCTGSGHLVVRLGENRLSTLLNCTGSKCPILGEQFTVDATYIHSEYSAERHDISLLRLATRVQFTKHIRPICLLLDPLFRNLDDHIIKFRISGWGLTQSTEHRYSHVLHTTSLYNIGRSNCYRQYPNNVISRDHICAGRASVSVCNGDSGGPLTARVRYDHEDTTILFGIVSFGHTDCSKATVFTNVMAHLKWIVNTVRREEYSQIRMLS